MLSMGAIGGDVVAAHEVAGGHFRLSASMSEAIEVTGAANAQARRFAAASNVVAIGNSVVANRRQRAGGTSVMALGQNVLAQRRQISGGQGTARILSLAAANMRASAAALEVITIGGVASLTFARFALAPLLRTLSVPADVGGDRAMDVRHDDRAIHVPPDRAEFRIVAHRREQ